MAVGANARSIGCAGSRYGAFDITVTLRARRIFTCQ
jgi:hypothetical protein